MRNRLTGWKPNALAALALLMAGCGGVSLWPFGRDATPERSRVPANATGYQCDGEKRFYVRYLEGGGAAWVILAEREFRLDKVAAAAGARYSNGSATLDVNGNEAVLADPPAISFTACKAAAGG